MRVCKAPTTLSDYVLQACIKTNTTLYYPQIRQCWEVRPLYTVDRSVVKFSEDRQLKKSIAYNRKKFCLVAKKIGKKPILIMERYDEVFTLFPVDFITSELEIVDVPKRNVTKVDTNVYAHELEATQFSEKVLQQRHHQMQTTEDEEDCEEDDRIEEEQDFNLVEHLRSLNEIELEGIDDITEDAVTEPCSTSTVLDKVQSKLSGIQTELQLDLEIPMTQSDTKSNQPKDNWLSSVTGSKKPTKPLKKAKVKIKASKKKEIEKKNQKPARHDDIEKIEEKERKNPTTYLAVPSRVDEEFIKDSKTRPVYDPSLKWAYSIRKFKKADESILTNKGWFQHQFGTKSFNDKNLFSTALKETDAKIAAFEKAYTNPDKYDPDFEPVYECVITSYKKPVYVMTAHKPHTTYKIIDYITKDVVFDTRDTKQKAQVNQQKPNKKVQTLSITEEIEQTVTGKSVKPAKPVAKTNEKIKDNDKVYAFPKNKGSSKFLDKCIATGRGFMVLRKDQVYYTVSLFADASDSITSKIPRINSTELSKTAALGKLLYTSSSSVFVVVRNGEYRYVLRKTTPVQTMQIIDCVTDKPVMFYGKPVMFPETLDLSNKAKETPMFRKVSTEDISGNAGITTFDGTEPDSYVSVLLKIEQALTRIANALDKR